MQDDKMQYVEKMMCDDVRNKRTDIIVLKDGRCIGITDERLDIYRNLDDMHKGEVDHTYYCDLTLPLKEPR